VPAATIPDRQLHLLHSAAFDQCTATGLAVRQTAGDLFVGHGINVAADLGV
jgi:hypothetical protein